MSACELVFSKIILSVNMDRTINTKQLRASLSETRTEDSTGRAICRAVPQPPRVFQLVPVDDDSLPSRNPGRARLAIRS